MLPTHGNSSHAQNQGRADPPLALNTVQRPFSPLIWAFYHYFRRPTYIRFKDTAPSESKNSLPRIDLTPRRRRLMLAALNQPELAHPPRPGVR